MQLSSAARVSQHKANADHEKNRRRYVLRFAEPNRYNSRAANATDFGNRFCSTAIPDRFTNIMLNGQHKCLAAIQLTAYNSAAHGRNDKPLTLADWATLGIAWVPERNDRSMQTIGNQIVSIYRLLHKYNDEAIVGEMRGLEKTHLVHLLWAIQQLGSNASAQDILCLVFNCLSHYIEDRAPTSAEGGILLEKKVAFLTRKMLYLFHPRGREPSSRRYTALQKNVIVPGRMFVTNIYNLIDEIAEEIERGAPRSMEKGEKFSDMIEIFLDQLALRREQDIMNEKRGG